MSRIILFLAVAVLISACSSSNSSRARELSIRYGEIVEVRRVPVPSAAPVGAIVGGFTGLVLSQGSSRGSRVASTVGGAALGGIAAAALEGDRRAYQYHVRFRDGRETDYITENGFLRMGDCVAVERGEYANIRRVSNALCEPGPRPPEITSRSELAASQCHEAKDQLLAADSEEEIDQATRKVRILCQF